MKGRRAATMVRLGADQVTFGNGKEAISRSGALVRSCRRRRRVAAEILDPITRRKMLEIAESYEGLARRAGERQHMSVPILE